MKIYTKTGDQGETGLLGNRRVAKDHPRIETYGTVDELNAVLGEILTVIGTPNPVRGTLERIQNELFQLGAELATPSDKKPFCALLDASASTRLEQEIDLLEKDLPTLKSFVLPGGSTAGAKLHVARTVSRRAERILISLHHVEPQRAEVLIYLNRLSDYLFVAARWVNFKASVHETPWVSPAVQ